MHRIRLLLIAAALWLLPVFAFAAPDTPYVTAACLGYNSAS
ncbi:MAG: hypothetical protein Q4C54_07555 [Clostridia bacterium]|nr:hypothetical protein [Clostridia bacterium]